MLQYYTLIFWRKHERQDITFDEIAEQAYKTISIYQKLPEKYRPNYLRVYRKEDAKLFEWSYQNFYNELKKGVNQENGQIFVDLGYSIGFFSALDNNDACGYSIGVGKTNELFSNTFVIDLALDMDYFTPENSKLIEELFRETVQTFEPYFGATINSLMDNCNYFNKTTNELQSLHWLTYVSPELSTNLKESKLKKLMKKYKEFEYDNGFIKLQNIALNAENPKDVKYKEEVERELL